MDSKVGRLLGSVVALTFSLAVAAQDDAYIHVSDDLARGIELQEIADRAFAHAPAYWEHTHGHARDDHDHPEHAVGEHAGSDEELSAGEAVAEIYSHAELNRNSADPLALDIVNVTIAVVDAWPDCEDTFDAVRAAVTLLPGRADEIVATVAVKRDCNCSNGGIWVDQHLDERIRVEMRHVMLTVPVQCSCSQVAMHAGIAGLPENREFNPAMDDAQKAKLIARMTEQVTIITERTAALQNKNGWECGCADVNLAATMQGIEQDELRDGTYEGLAEKYAEQAGDTGLVVDSFGVVGLQPMEYWGDRQYMTRDNTLRRKPEVYRGDALILDPFHPATEFEAYGDHNFDSIHKHVLRSDSTPTDLIISEYIEGWNEAALARPPDERDPEQRNRLIELYNGSDKTIDLGNDQYFLEIYAGSAQDSASEGSDRPVWNGKVNPRQVISLSAAIEPGGTHVIVFSQSDEVLTDDADLVTSQLDFAANETLVVRRLGGETALNCRVQSHSYVMNYPAIPIIRLTVPFNRRPPGIDEAASPN